MGRRIHIVALTAAALLSAGTAAAADGEKLYATNCGVCHLADGAGTPGLAPPLRTDLWKRLGAKAPGYLAGVMLTGMVGVPLDGQRYGAAMPPWGQLSDAELAAIGTYVLQKLNSQRMSVDAGTVKKVRETGGTYASLKTLRDGGT